jgi:NAD(P)-dependent dehydrogenase (short-subunit alcohol dehydrogenase family)
MRDKTMKWILITGSNRGIGFGLVRQYLQQSGTFIFATCRDPDRADSLRNLAASYPDRIQIAELDVTDDSTIEQAARLVQRRTDCLDVLINNAGINPPRDEQTLDSVTSETMQQVYAVNTIGPLVVTRTFIDFLRAAENPKLIMMSSQLGSLTRAHSGRSYAYCASKAALNMVMRLIAAELSQFGITTITLHPGWVQTEMGGNNARLTVDESAQGVISVIENATLQDNGEFFNWNGESLPW